VAHGSKPGQLNSASLKSLLRTMQGKRILVVGDVMLDEYIWGDVRRISPEAPVPVVAVRRRTRVPGGAGNTAMNVASLGGHASLASAIGADTSGERLSELLRQHGISVDGMLIDETRATTTKTRIVAHHQHVVRIDEEQVTRVSPELENRLLNWLERRIPETDACVLSDYDKGVISSCLAQRFIAMARQAGKPVVVDPKGTDYGKYRGATVVKPNVEEAKSVFPQSTHDCDPSAPAGGETGLHGLARSLMNLFGNSAVLLTRGANGMTLFESTAAPLHIHSMAREVFDVTGAGDTVTATLALALAAAASLPDAAALANRAAGIVVGKVGTARTTPDEVLRAQAQIGDPLFDDGSL
jgi:D-beta-D-heptose 7-phosphate kinase/D-beta-D-heptose 1-phosphate adenosyltransferase